MTGFKVVNLKTLLEEVGEDRAKEILSSFSCPLNCDVQDYFKRKAIEFAKHGWAQTHLVYTSYRGIPVLVGYFALSNKQITIFDSSREKLGVSMKRKIREFSTYDNSAKAFYLAAPLIGQLGKNFFNGYNKLITGDELLKIACDKIDVVQTELGGRFAYVECEDKPQLVQFYRRNGFFEFDHRKLDRDELGKLDGEYLVQLLKKIK